MYSSIHPEQVFKVIRVFKVIKKALKLTSDLDFRSTTFYEENNSVGQANINDPVPSMSKPFCRKLSPCVINNSLHSKPCIPTMYSTSFWWPLCFKFTNVMAIKHSKTSAHADESFRSPLLLLPMTTQLTDWISVWPKGTGPGLLRKSKTSRLCSRKLKANGFHIQYWQASHSIGRMSGAKQAF